VLHCQYIPIVPRGDTDLRFPQDRTAGASHVARPDSQHDFDRATDASTHARRIDAPRPESYLIGTTNGSPWRPTIARILVPFPRRVGASRHRSGPSRRRSRSRLASQGSWLAPLARTDVFGSPSCSALDRVSTGAHTLLAGATVLARYLIHRAFPLLGTTASSSSTSSSNTVASISFGSCISDTSSRKLRCGPDRSCAASLSPGQHPWEQLSHALCIPTCIGHSNRM